MARGRVLGAKGRKQGAVVEMAPLIDMVFILLIFFVVSTSFVKEAGVDIARPRSAFAEVVKDGFLPVAIDKAGVVRAGDMVIAPSAVDVLADILRRSGHQRIVIQADRDVPTALLLDVLDTCRMSGAHQVDVAALKARR